MDKETPTTLGVQCQCGKVRFEASHRPVLCAACCKGLSMKLIFRLALAWAAMGFRSPTLSYVRAAR